MIHISFNVIIFLSTAISLASCNLLNKTTNDSTIISKEVQQESNQVIVVEQPKTTPKSNTTKKNKKEKNKQNVINNNAILIIPSNVINGKWIIYSAKGKATSGDDRPYIIFDESTKTMYANNGCNTLNAEYKLSDNSLIEFSNMLSTQRYCHDAKYETEINDALANVKSISISTSGNEYYMSFLDYSNNILMILRKPNLEFINGTWKITKVNGTHCKNKDYELAIDLTEQKVHGRVGCNIVNGSILLDAGKPNSITFLDLISTKMSCPDNALETEIYIALEKAEYYKRGKDDKTITLYDKDNNAVLELSNTTDKYSQK